MALNLTNLKDELLKNLGNVGSNVQRTIGNVSQAYNNSILSPVGQVKAINTQVIKPVQNYFNPQVSGTQGFWGTPTAQSVAGTQRYTQPVKNFLDTASNSTTGTLGRVAGLASSIPYMDQIQKQEQQDIDKLLSLQHNAKTKDQARIYQNMINQRLQTSPVQSFYKENTPSQKDVVLSSLINVGSVISPGMALGGIPFGIGAKALENKISGRPLNENLTPGAVQGFEQGSLYGGLSKILSPVLNPAMSKVLGPEMQGINTYLNMAKNASPAVANKLRVLAAKRIAQSLIKEGVNWGIPGGIIDAISKDADTFQKRIENGIEGFKNAAVMGAVLKGGNIGIDALVGQVIKPAVQAYANMSPKQKEGGFIKIGKPKEEMVKVYRTSKTLEPGTQVFDNPKGAQAFATPNEPVIEFSVPKSKLESSVVPEKAKAGIFDYTGDKVISPNMGTSGKVVEQKLNTERLGLNEEQTKLVTDLQNKLGLGTRKVRSFQEVTDLANQLGTDPNKLLAEIQNGRITDKEVKALSDVVNTSSNRIIELSKKLKADPTSTRVQAELQAEESLLSQALSKRIKGGTEAGRAVGAFRIIANRNLEPAYWLDKAQRQIGEGKTLKPETISAINSLIDNKDRLGLATFISKLGESTTQEKVTSLWKAGLLTGFRTHEANMISNTGYGLLENIKDIPATIFDIARSKVTGTPRAKTFNTKMLVEESKGLYKGVGMAKDYLKTGIDPRDLAKSEIVRPIRFGESKGGKLAQKYVDTVFGTLGAEDKIFREGHFYKSIAEQASLEGINKKLSVAQIDELIKNPAPEMVNQASKEAAIATFNNPNALSEGVKAFKKAAGPNVAAFTDFTAPFVRTPTNVAGAIASYTPVGFIKDFARKLINGQSVTDRELSEAFGRSVTGTALVWLGSELAKRGLISGNTPASPAERSQANLENRPNGAILINGKWQQISRVSPFGNLLLLGAEYNKANGDLTQTGIAGLKGLTEQTFLKGVSQGLQAVNDPEQNAQAYINSAAAGFVPTLGANIAAGQDTVQRRYEGIGQAVQARIPGLRENLPAKLSALGEPLPQEGGILGNLFDPFNTREPSADPLVNEFTRVGYNLNTVDDQLNNLKLTRAKADEYQKLAGKYIREAVTPLISSQKYQALNVDQQKDSIEKVVNKAKSLAREEIKKGLTINDYQTGVNNLPILAGNVGAADYVKSADSPQGLNRLGLYKDALISDPGTTINAVIKGQPIRKITGSTVVFERQQGLGALDNGNIATQVDHKVALSLGGSNDKDNLQILSATDNAAKGKVEQYLSKLLAQKKITKEEAQKRDLNWRDEIANLPEAEKIAIAKDVGKVAPESDPNLQFKIIDNKGNSKSIDLTPIEAPKLTGFDNVDKKLISTYKSALTSQSTNIISLYKDGQLTAEQASKMLNDIKLSTSKVTTTKPKKPAKFTIKKISSAPIKISAPKAIKLPKMQKIKIKKPSARRFTIKV